MKKSKNKELGSKANCCVLESSTKNLQPNIDKEKLGKVYINEKSYMTIDLKEIERKLRQEIFKGGFRK